MFNEKLILKAKQGDISARNKLITDNIKFFYKYAYKNMTFKVGQSKGDLLSEAILVIDKALRTYDSNDKMSFASWLHCYIRAAYLNIRRISSRHTNISLDKPISETNKLTLIGLIRSKDIPHDITILKSMEIDRLKKGFKFLNEGERYTICSIYNINYKEYNLKVTTYKAIATKINVTYQIVQVYYAIGLKKLIAYTKFNKVRFFGKKPKQTNRRSL